MARRLSGRLSEKQLIKRGWVRLFEFEKFTIWQIPQKAAGPWVGLYVVGDSDTGLRRERFWISHDQTRFARTRDAGWLEANAPDLMTRIEKFMREEFTHDGAWNNG